MTVSTVLIFSFVFGFSKPTVFLIFMLVIQILYLLYIFLFISWTKRRYKVFTIAANLCFIAILSCLYGLASSVDTPAFENYSKAYAVLVVLLCTILCLGIIVEILAQRYKIRRQLISIKNRFILCEKIESKV